MSRSDESYRPDLIEIIDKMDRRLRALEQGTPIFDYAEGRGYNTGFIVNIVDTAVATLNLSVPDWAKSAVVAAWAYTAAKNTSGGYTFLYNYARINGSTFGEQFNSVNDNVFGMIQSSATLLINNPPPVITVENMTSTQGTNWPADPNNRASITALAIFHR